MVKFILGLVFVLVTPNAWGALVSPFESEAKNEGITIPGARYIDATENTVLMRSNRIRSQEEAKQVADAGFTDVIMFKNETQWSQGEEAQEREWLKNANSKINFVNIPFKWKNFYSFKEACEQTVEALGMMVAVDWSKEDDDIEDRKLLVHCTVGEDRTGYLSALYRLLLGEAYEAYDENHMKSLLSYYGLPANPDQTHLIRKVFLQEMCEHGYEAGNPNKNTWQTRPRVTLPIRAFLTPLFLKMAYKITFGYISYDNLLDDPDAVAAEECTYDPERSTTFKNSSLYDASEYECKSSRKLKRQQSGVN